METLTKKEDLRIFALEKRKLMARNGVLREKSSIIVSKILNSSDFKNARNIALYYPHRNEIDLTLLLNFKRKNYFFPRCAGKKLEFCKVESINELRVGNFGILEPQNPATDPKILDLIYIPALIANKKNFRLGYGKGFYDRFFAQNNLNAKKIIVVANDLILNNFCEDEFDYRCDSIMSD